MTAYQSINQSINQLTNQPTNPSIHQWTVRAWKSSLASKRLKTEDFISAKLLLMSSVSSAWWVVVGSLVGGLGDWC